MRCQMSETNGRVLIIDDDESVLAGTSELLTYEGFEVETSTSVLTVAALVRSFKPEVVLLDLTMPALGGERFLGIDRVRSLFGGAQVILYSGRSPSELASVAERCSADGFFPKEYGTKRLLDSMRRWMNRSREALCSEVAVDEAELGILLRTTTHSDHRRQRELEERGYSVARTESDAAALRFLESGTCAGAILVETLIHEALTFLEKTLEFDAPRFVISRTPDLVRSRVADVHVVDPRIDTADLAALIDRVLIDRSINQSRLSDPGSRLPTLRLPVTLPSG